MANELFHTFSMVPQLGKQAISHSVLRTASEANAVRQTVNELAHRLEAPDNQRIQGGKIHAVVGVPDTYLVTTGAGTFHMVSRHEGLAASCFIKHIMLVSNLPENGGSNG